jgi:hypothetical protein
MMDTTALNRYIIPSAIAFGAVLVSAIMILMLIDNALMKIPMHKINKSSTTSLTMPAEDDANHELKYNAIIDRNLFRSKLYVELPKPKTEQEIEEDNFANILNTFILKGVWIGDENRDHFAFIDKGPQKGVWIHRNGDQMDGGLTLAEIRPNSILVTKGELGAVLTLFIKGFEKTQIRKTTDKQRKSVSKNSSKINN